MTRYALMRPSPKLPTSKLAAELTEAGRRKRQAPGCVQCSAGSDSTQERSRAVVDVNYSESWTGDLVLAVGVLLRVRDVDPTAEILDPKRPVSFRQVRIHERSWVVQQLEGAVEDVDPPVVEVGCIEARTSAVVPIARPCRSLRACVAATTASVGATDGFQPRIVPASVAKRNRAGPTPRRTKLDVPLKTAPVGPPGTLTTSDTGVPLPW